VAPDPTGFSREVAKFGYHIQDAFYRRVMALEGHEIDRFIFISVGKEAPHHVGVFELDWRSLQEGEAATKYALEKFSNARKTGIWDYGYGELQTIQIPSWSFEHTRQTDLTLGTQRQGDTHANFIRRDKRQRWRIHSCEPAAKPLDT
jgi:hypothetical protein